MSFAIVATVGGALIGADASDNASDAQVASSADATAESRRQYDLTRGDTLEQYAQVRADQAPYRDAGTGALGRITAGLAPGGAYSKRFTIQDYQADPGYQFRVQQGEQGIKRAAAARGGQYSGATLKALADFNSGLASQEYGNAYSRFNTDQTTGFNRDASVAGIGQTANTAVGNAGNATQSILNSAGQNSANQIGQNMQNAGEARASGYVGQSNAIGAGIRGAYNNYAQNQILNGYQSKPFGTSGNYSSGAYVPEYDPAVGGY